MKKWLILVFIIIASLPVFVKGELTGSCTLATTCPGGSVAVANFYASFNDNAHACIDKSTNCYPYKLCCQGTGNMVFNRVFPASQAQISLSSIYNAHVENVSENNYLFNYVFSTTIGDTTCSVVSGGCQPTDYCLFSLNDITNAHIAQCGGSYSYNYCCNSSVYVPPPPPPPPPGSDYLNITSISCPPGNELDKGENFDFIVDVVEVDVSVPQESASDGSSVELFMIYDDGSGGVLTSMGTQTTSGGSTTFSFGIGNEGNYLIYANASKSGFVSDDDGSPNCEFDVIDTGGGDGGDGDIPPGTFVVYSECYCPSGGCDDGIGVLDISIFNLLDKKLIRQDQEAQECFLSEENIPFIGNLGILMFILVLTLFYSNEMLKRK